MVAGLLLILLGWFLGRRYAEIRRPALLAGTFCASTAGAAMGIAALGARSRQE